MATEQVELVEDDAAEPAPRARGHRRGRVALVAAAMALVLGLVGGQAVLDARRRAQQAEAQAVPGVLAPLDEPRALWSLPWDAPAGSGVRVGDLLVWAEVRAGALALTGSRMADGATAWQAEATLPAGLAAALSRGDEGAAVGCVALAAPGRLADRAACVARGAAPSDGGHAPTSLVVVDGAGTLVVERALTADLWTARADHLVLATADGVDDLTWTVTEQTAEGTVVWSTTLDPAPAPASPEPTDAWIGLGPALQALGTCTTLSTLTRATVLDEDGSVVATVGTTAKDVVQPARGCGLHVQTFDERVRERVVLPRGRELDPGTGPAVLWVDDGSAADLLLTSERGTALGARDAGSGELRWESRLDPNGVTLLDGRVYAAAEGAVAALDAGDGSELWRTDVHFVVRSVLTDGRHVLALGAAGQLARLDLADGTLLSTVDLRDLLPAEAFPGVRAELHAYPWNGVLRIAATYGSQQDRDAWRTWLVG